MRMFPALNLLRAVDQIGRYLGAQYLGGNRKRAVLEALRALLKISEEFPLPQTRDRVMIVLNSEAERGMVPTALHAELPEVLRAIRLDVEGWVPMAIPVGNSQFLDPYALKDTVIEERSPLVASELRCAARCLAYDEPTACVLHLMRAMDFGIKVIAKSLAIADAERLMWGKAAEEIESELRKRHGTKDWRLEEPYYAKAVLVITSMSTGYRAPLAHDLREALTTQKATWLLGLVQDFFVELGSKFADWENPIAAGRSSI